MAALQISLLGQANISAAVSTGMLTRTNQFTFSNYKKRNLGVIYLQRGSTRSLSRKSWSFFTAAISMGDWESIKGDTILRQLLSIQMKIHCLHLKCFACACSLKSSMTDFTQLWFPSSCICDPFSHFNFFSPFKGTFEHPSHQLREQGYFILALTRYSVLSCSF